MKDDSRLLHSCRIYERHEVMNHQSRVMRTLKDLLCWMKLSASRTSDANRVITVTVVVSG